jgi:hypothetical protein
MIRRFDVFAEYTRQQAIGDGIAPDVAKGYSLWLAMEVAARRWVLNNNVACSLDLRAGMVQMDGTLKSDFGCFREGF